MMIIMRVIVILIILHFMIRHLVVLDAVVGDFENLHFCVFVLLVSSLCFDIFLSYCVSIDSLSC